MTKTVEKATAELDAEIQDYPLKSVIRAMAPQARLGWLVKALQELDLPTDFLEPAQALAGREQDLARRVSERQQQATNSRGGGAAATGRRSWRGLGRRGVVVDGRVAVGGRIAGSAAPARGVVGP